MTKIALRGKSYEIRLLSAAEMLECLQMAQDCLKRISSVDGYDGLAEALAENSSLACCCLYQNGKRGFPKLKDTTIKTHAYDTSNNQILEVKPYETPYILRIQLR